MNAWDEGLHVYHGKVDMEHKRVNKDKQMVDLEWLNHGLVADAGITWDTPSNHLHIKAPKQLRKRQCN